jgi:hypothetical protein
VKKEIFFIAVALALLIFAIPAVASPPVALPTIEAVGPVAYMAPVVVQEVAPAIGVTPLLYESPSIAQAVTPEGFAVLALILFIATAPTLAGLMREVSSSGKRLRSDRGIANGFTGGRRWV